MQTQTVTEQIAGDTSEFLWRKMPKRPVSSSPYVVDGHDGVWQLSTKRGAIRIHNSLLEDPMQNTRGGVVKTIAADNDELQALARHDARLLLAMHLNVPVERVHRNTGPGTAQINTRNRQI